MTLFCYKRALKRVMIHPFSENPSLVCKAEGELAMDSGLYQSGLQCVSPALKLSFPGLVPHSNASSWGDPGCSSEEKEENLMENDGQVS